MDLNIPKLFIDHEVNVFQGQNAEIKIKERNDSKYIEDNSVHKVDKIRWMEAQYYERKTWMELCAGCYDDRNHDHFQNFENYAELINHKEKIKNVIELGCGPFTNLRTLYHLLPALEEVHLLDPLLEDYLNHVNCTYKNRNFMWYKTITHNCPIEEYSDDKKFNLIIMNNVLEHCFDIKIIFNKINEMLDTNGLFVFHDVCYDENSVIDWVDNTYDSGHPLKLSDKYLDNFLSNFESLFSKTTLPENEPGKSYKYFIGKKIK